MPAGHPSRAPRHLLNLPRRLRGEAAPIRTCRLACRPKARSSLRQRLRPHPIPGAKGVIRIPDRMLFILVVAVLLLASVVAFLLAETFSGEDPPLPEPPRVERDDGGAPGSGAGASNVNPPSAKGGISTLTSRQIQQGSQRIIRQWHVLASQGDVAGVWANLSPRKRRQKSTDPTESVSEWQQAQVEFGAQLATPEFARVQVRDVDPDTGGVEIFVSNLGYTGSCESGRVGDKWVGITWVLYQGGSWYYEPGYSTTQQRRDRWEDNPDQLLGASCNAP